MQDLQTNYFVGKEADSQFKDFLNSLLKRKQKVFLLTDSICNVHCKPLLTDLFPELEAISTIVIPAGEEYKNLDSCLTVWEGLTSLYADRNSVLLNLGGGSLSDIGGFCASTYKRGISFVNIPTTLLAQVDASIGGKTAVNFMGNKNLLGTFSAPIAVYVHPEFLTSLPDRQIRSGVAEMLKHALVKDADYWHKMNASKLKTLLEISRFIPRSINIKKELVEIDPLDKAERKKLNFGHTVGHALESLFLDQNESLYHGEAIAIGMICESYLSFKYAGLSHSELDEICSGMMERYSPITIPSDSFYRLIQLMQNDKKNANRKINFTLLKTIGSAIVNQELEADAIIDSLQFYNDKTALILNRL